MSYILEALKKSDQERSRGEVPNIETLQPVMAVPPESKSNKTLWIGLLLGLNLLVAVFWLGLQFSKNSQQIAQQQQPPVSPVVADKTTVAPVISAPQPEKAAPVSTYTAPQPKAEITVVEDKYTIRKEVMEASPGVIQKEEQSEPHFEVIQPKTRPTVDAFAAESSEPDIDYSVLPYLTELDDYQRQGIPRLEFSSHMFSSVPSFRTVVINGNNLREGDSLAKGLYVSAITEEGVVLDKDGTTFRVNVMQQWTFE